jgi:cysteine desulfurase
MQAYLDHASTSPLRPEALAAMLPFLTEHYGNPSASNAPGRRARLVLDEARDRVARSVGCDPGEVVFCSGGTEAANLAVSGAMAGSKALCTAIEHPAVLKPVTSSGGGTVRVGRNGTLDLDHLESLLGPGIALVAVMIANNEIGTVQPISEVAELVRRHAPRAALLVDAVHAVGWLDVAELCACADMLVISAHKFGGPKGTGALVVRNGTSWAPSGLGGAQERERRPGTENVAGIAGMAAAIVSATEERPETVARISLLRDRLADSICSALEGVTETAVSPASDGVPDRSGKVAGSCHLMIEGVERDELLFLLDREGVYASAGSACASGAAQPSHVLEAIGADFGAAEFGSAELGSNGVGSALRLSLGHTTTDDEIDHAVSVIPKIVGHLRA